eukprot:1121549_1
MDGNEANAKQVAFFEWEHLEQAIRSAITNTIEWKIVIIHKDIKRVSVHKEHKLNTTAHMMKKYTLEATRLHYQMAKDRTWDNVPLHQFDANHVCDV